MSAPPVNNGSGTATVVLRDLLPKPPTTKPGDAGEIEFCHPGYEPPYDVLFLFPRLDHTSTSLKGVHYGTALTACQIIANNAFDGYLATDQEGRERVGPDINFDHVLTESKYWFFVPTGQNPSPNPYPIVPSFQDWAFPHGKLASWPQQDKETDFDVNPRCIITQAAGLINQAHIIPASDDKWFKLNAMARYGNRHDVNQKKNRIALRHDIHSAFDSHLFAIVPKNNHYVIHQFHDNDICAREFASTYHNRIVVSEGVVREFLFARLARALLMLIKPFMTQFPLKRYVVRLRAVEDSNVESGQYRTQTEWLSPQQLFEQYSGGGTKSASPTKRKRNDENPSDNQQEYEEDNDSSDYKSNSDDSDTEGEWYKNNVAVLLEGDRGRSRKRRRGDTSSDSDTEEEWYKKNVAVLLEGDRGRSQKRRCDEPGVDDGWASRHNNSQPPSLTTSISSIQSCAGLEQGTSSHLGVEVQGQELSKGNTNQNDVRLETLL